MLKKIIIAIDGHSSCGKSTMARALASHLGYTFIDSGAMYRAVALYFTQNGVDKNDADQVDSALENISIQFVYNPQRGASDTYLNGKNVEDEIRSMEVAQFVSKVSTISAVRRFLVKQQQQMGADKGLVMDGRDIGTVVFPDAELKIFLTARPEVRAERRQKELAEKGQNVPLNEVMENLLERDRIDSTRADSPLKQADDAVVLDNSDITREEQFELAVKWANERMHQTAC
ncbi:MAG: (d)CMP kinase [Bacteroidota bacterium]